MNNIILTDKDREAVVSILVEQLEVEQSQVTEDADIQGDLGADSLDIMEILLALEERFNLSIPDEVSERVKTVGDLCEALQSQLSQPQ
jgi:acyl carrier protein